MTISAKICEIIRNVRVSKGYSQEYLSEKLGLTTEAYGKIERAQTKMELERLDKICEILGIQLDLHCQINPPSYQKMRLVSIVYSESNPEKTAEEEILYLRKKVIKLLRKILTPAPPIAERFRRISYT